MRTRYTLREVPESLHIVRYREGVTGIGCLFQSRIFKFQEFPNLKRVQTFPGMGQDLQYIKNSEGLTLVSGTTASEKCREGRNPQAQNRVRVY